MKHWELYYICLFFFFFFGHTHGMQKFTGQGSHLCHSSDSAGLFSFLFFFLSFCCFRATPLAYGGSQARGQIRAIAVCLSQSHNKARYKPRLWLHHGSWQCQILNPLSEARDRTHNPMVPSWIWFHCTMMGTPRLCWFLNLLSH